MATMQSSGIQLRKRNTELQASASAVKAKKRAAAETTNIPRYMIDLSLPPAERYRHVAEDFKCQIASLPILFDEVVQSIHPRISVSAVRSAARLLLRRLHDKEQNEELKGIRKVTGVRMYMLVAFNVLLDLFMGCTSGGFQITPENEDSRMLHFRTLDWGMDALRQIVVHLDFVRYPGGPVYASSVTYVGYVGVLTGVKEGLSMSLNFRPNHDASTQLANFRFYLHHLMVLFGFRPSISSVLRHILLSGDAPIQQHGASGQTLDSIKTFLPTLPTTAAYLIFSDGDETITMEKDHHTAVVKSSEDFIAITNHDEAEELEPEKMKSKRSESHKALEVTGMTELTEESISRKRCTTKQWERSRSKSSRVGSKAKAKGLERVTKLLKTYPITNEETHYAVVMDPKAGKVVWEMRYLEPLY